MNTDLTGETDDVLDAALLVFYAEHNTATEAKDSTAQAEAHWAILAILSEQARRRDIWIEQKLNQG